MDAASMSRVIRRLAREGDIEPVSSRRQAFWRLTELGRTRLQFLIFTWDAADARLRSWLGRDFVDPILTCAERLPRRWRQPNGTWRD
jgi:DNA-binding MarR family transcriptional regulator